MGGKSGDMHYWVTSKDHDKDQYVKTFKSHAEASDWWKKNKGSYKGMTFGQGSSKTKFK